MSFSGDLYPSVASKVMTTTGDLVRYDSQRERYGIGSTNQVLTVVGGLPAWANAGHVTQSRALEVACSEETTAITVADNLIKFRKCHIECSTAVLIIVSVSRISLTLQRLGFLAGL